METCIGLLQHISCDAHILVCACEYQIQFASAIHEYFDHVESSYLCFDYQSCMTWSRDRHRVIGPAKQDALCRPVDVLWDVSHGAFCEVDFLRKLLHLSSGTPVL
jgi:hypothetical protein